MAQVQLCQSRRRTGESDPFRHPCQHEPPIGIHLGLTSGDLHYLGMSELVARRGSGFAYKQTQGLARRIAVAEVRTGYECPVQPIFLRLYFQLSE